MGKWYEDKNLLAITTACDKAYYENDRTAMKDLSDKCFSEGHSPHNTIMLRAKYLYNSFTSLSDWIETSIGHDINNGLYKTKVDAIRAYEAYYERSYYLVRTAFDLCNEYILSDSIPDDIDRLLSQPAFIYSAPETILSRSAVRWLETATKFLLAQNQIFDERSFR